MKIKKIIDTVNRIKSNLIDDEDKLNWINEIEGIIFDKVFSKAEDTTFTFIPYIYDSDLEKELFIPVPYTGIYDYYLMAKIDELNNEIDSYNKNMTLYNNLYDEFAAYYRRNHLPKQTVVIRGF